MNEALRGDDSHRFDRLLGMGRRRRLPVTRQMEAAECGIACLAMILGWHGHHVSLAELRRRFPTSAKGSTLEDVIRWSDEAGFLTRPVRLDIDELPDLRCPCILHWDMDHFVVLQAVDGDRVVIHDPASGRRKLAKGEVSRHFTGVALELTKGPDFRRKQPPSPLSLRKLAGSVQGLGASLRQLLGFAIALEVIALFVPQFLQIVVDQVLADGDRDLLTLLGSGFLLLFVAQAVINAFRTWAVVRLSTHFTMNWTGNVFRHLMRLPHLYFLRRQMGDVVSRFGAINTIQQSLTTQFVGALMDGLMALATLVLLAVYSPALTVVVLAGAALYSVSRIAWFRTYQEANLSQIVVNARQQSSLIEAIRGVQTIQLNNQGAGHTSRYLRHTADALDTQVEVQRLNMLFSLAGGILSGLQRVGVLWIGAWLALRNAFTAGMLMAYVAYADQFTARAAAFADYLIQLRLLRLQGERLADIVLTPLEPNIHGSHAGSSPEPSIRFENVSFRYADSEPWIVFRCNFEIRAGESVAISGPSGCGKSTLLHLMLGMLEPQTGRILVGGIELRQIGKSRYRDMLGVVLQDDKLFAGSIADNIAFFSDDATFTRVEEAARRADIHDDIAAMPMGYNTLVGDMGSTLSGGQKQRLFLARALYRKPRILVLDEATSHLDVAREGRIASLISRLDVTRVVVSHRPETIAAADRVLYMQSGTVRAAVVADAVQGTAA
ncbi:peptidase domain-containing ABC transporter [Luteibacter aegosomatis]|uniref:peptidase domain-containing ABC transporter n=1 Tax=Luteibacter aegosomatis TaxID=2911537 RepID=UPI001FF9342B|nr:peptidase domain-containing ABC transporter [Luteibacter aegosomatis]UPG85444.1 peptidase domain-containing ABC transporter [Luteibacter aegosomatis]